VLKIEPAGARSEELVEAFRLLLPQLSSSASLPNGDELAAIVESQATTILVAKEGERIIGTLTLAVFRIPTGVRAWIEDVVVDESARGSGVGEALTREAIRLAREAGGRTVDLTSRPSREVANRMYEKVGFRRRETNVYRYDLG
jgi:ribosomal protein S18 acetylase RimI-like enzyme